MYDMLELLKWLNLIQLKLRVIVLWYDVPNNNIHFLFSFSYLVLLLVIKEFEKNIIIKMSYIWYPSSSFILNCNHKWKHSWQCKSGI